MVVAGSSVTDRLAICTPELLVTVPEKSTRISSTLPTGTTATVHDLSIANGPGAGEQLFGSTVAGGTIHEALAGETAMPPVVVALAVAVFGCVFDADDAWKYPL